MKLKTIKGRPSLILDLPFFHSGVMPGKMQKNNNMTM
jgi:hypothetical protein